MATSDLVTLADTKTFLNITNTTYDTQLSSFITAASDVIANRIGPIVGSPTYDEWYDGGRSTIVLRHTPVQSVQSVKEAFGGQTVFALNAVVLDSGSASSAYGYTVDLTNGLLTRRAMGAALPFAPGVQNIHVQYTAGYATVPVELQMAAKLLIQHLWSTQRGGSRRPGLGGDDVIAANGDADVLPARVEEILASFYIPGIA